MKTRPITESEIKSLAEYTKPRQVYFWGSDIYDLFKKDSWPEPVYEVIEEEYGNVSDPYNDNKEDSPCKLYRKSKEKYPCSGCEKYLCCEWTCWPKLNCDCGCGWGIEADLRKLKAKK
jgi:hypothetical protein